MNEISTVHKKIVLYVFYAIVGVVFLYFALPKLLVLFAPFIIAYLIAKLISPLVKLLNIKFKVPKKIASFISLIAVIGVFGYLIYLGINSLVMEIYSVIQKYDIIVQNVNEYIDYFQKWLPIESWRYVEQFAGNIVTYLINILKGLAQIMTGGVIKLPQTLLATVFTLLSAYFISSDDGYLKNTVRKYIPSKIYDGMSGAKHSIIFAAGAYIRAQLIMMSIVFTELLIWFLILGVDYAVLIALIIAIFDALPVLGSAAVLIPWAIVSFVYGNYVMGALLLAAYATTLLIRQFLEPKLVSSQIGMHPLLTIMSIYLGLMVYGFIGIIIGPMVLIIVKDLVNRFYKPELKG